MQKELNLFWKFGVCILDRQQRYGESTVRVPPLWQPTTCWENIKVTSFHSRRGFLVSQSTVSEGWGKQHCTCVATACWKQNKCCDKAYFLPPEGPVKSKYAPKKALKPLGADTVLSKATENMKLSHPWLYLPSALLRWLLRGVRRQAHSTTERCCKGSHSQCKKAQWHFLNGKVHCFSSVIPPPSHLRYL